MIFRHPKVRSRRWAVSLFVASLLAPTTMANAGTAPLTVSPPYQISSSNTDGYGPVAIAWSGTHYLTAWVDATSKHVLGALVDSAGTVVRQVTLFNYPEALGISSPAVGWDGSSFLVVASIWGWYGTDLPPGTHIQGVGVSADGTVITHPVAISSAMPLGGWGNNSPAVAGSVARKSFYVAWQEDHGPLVGNGPEVVGAEVMDQGHPLVTLGERRLSYCYCGIPSDTSPGRASVASDGRDFLVVWDQYALYPNTAGNGLNGQEVYATIINSELADPLVPGGLPISSDQAGSNAAVTSDGTEYFVAWMDTWPDSPSYATNAMGRRLSSAGVPLDLHPFTIKGSNSVNGTVPTAWDGQNFVVAWQTLPPGYSVSAGRVSAAGVVFDTTGVPITTTGLRPMAIGAPEKRQTAISYLEVDSSHNLHPFLQVLTEP